MSTDLMTKIRYWDTVMVKWLMRHFYMTFFQIVLVVVFVFWFINTISVIDIGSQTPVNLAERALVNQSVNMNLIVFLMLLNSFWLLFMFSTIQNLRSLLKDIIYNTSRLRTREKTL